MSLSRPLWNPKIAGLLVRVPLGLYFVCAGRVKLMDPGGFIETVRQFKILPEQLSTLVGVLMPYCEVGIGVLLIIGLWTVLGSIGGALLLISYIFAIHIFPYPDNPFIFNKDIILLSGCLSLLASGAGGFSVDGFRQSG